MDLGIKGSRALLCASSRGLGLACATALAAEGCAVTINGRNPDRLREAAERVRAETGADVSTVQADINTEDGRRTFLAACPDPDILVTNNEGPTPGNFQDFGRAEWMFALEAQMLAPLDIIRAVLPGMRARKFGRIVNIVSALVKSPRNPAMTLSSAPRTGLVAACKAISRDAAADNVTINNLLPERIDTDRQRFMADRMMKAENITREEARRRMAENLPAKRLGSPEEFGAACAFLCSAKAGFISGQMLQLDGGSYQGLV